MTAARRVIGGLNALMPFIQQEAVDELALRLSGLYGEDQFRECVRLANATLAAMQDNGDIGPVEIAVVLATLQAATTKASQMQVGHA